MSEKAIVTLCESCVFNNRYGEKQIGCKLGKLERFLERGEASFVDGTNSYVIDRMCMFCRDNNWLKSNNWSEAMNRINKETEIRHSYVVLYNKEDSFDSLKETLLSIKKQDKQFQILVINNKDNGESQQVFNFLKEEFRHFQHYSVETIMPGFDHDDNSLMKTYISKIKGSWFTIVKAGFIVPPTFTHELQKALNDNLEKFVCAWKSPDDINLQTYMYYVAKGWGGNNPMAADLEDEEAPILYSLVEKIQYFAAKEGHEFMIKVLND